MTQFISVTERVTNSKGQDPKDKQRIIALAAIAHITALQAGGALITLMNGNTVTAIQSFNAFEKLVDVTMTDKDVDPKLSAITPEEAVNEAQNEDDDETGDTANPDDLFAICTAKAKEIIEAEGLDVTAIEPNTAGKIGVPEVNAYKKTLEAAEAANEDADEEDAE